MTDELRPLPKLLDRDRDRVIEQLTRQYALERLDAQEFEMRVDRVYEARTVAELESIQADLPALPSGWSVQTASTPASVSPRRFLLAVMGGVERKGSWRPARQLNALAVMGGIHLDFREAAFAPGVTELNVLACMGGVEILVPPGLRLESDGIGLMGGFDGRDTHIDDPDAPTLRIRGLALMGGVTVQERLPGESAGDKRRRVKEEKQRRLRGSRER